MDQMNLLPNSSQRLDPSRDLLQTAPSAWMVHSHNSSVMPWPSQPLPLGSLYFAHQQSFHRPPANLGPMHPMHSGQHGTLPHPDRNMRGLQNPESVHGLPSGAVYWGSPLQPTPGMPGLTASMHSSGTGMMSTGPSAVTSVGGFGNSNTNTRDLALRPPTALDWASSAATSGTHSVSPSHLSFSEGLSQTPGQQFGSQTTVPAFPLSPVSPRRPGQSSSPPSYRSHRSQPLTSSLGYRDNTGPSTPASDRRRQTYSHARRSMSSRQPSSDPVRSQDEIAQQLINDSLSSRSSRRGSHGLTAAQVEDAVMRQMQMYRGTVQSKMVASKAALQSLESIETCTLPENERTCVICYNDYGVASPEGINEAALRLPQCKHVFGDHCIKKWLEDSDSCPYCRSKLQSEPKHSLGSARTFMQMMRLRGLPLPSGISEEMIARAVTRPVVETEFQELYMRSIRTAERRSPPDDSSGQDQRRTRQRRNSSGVAGESQFAELAMLQSLTAPSAGVTHQTSRPMDPDESAWIALSTPATFVPSEPFYNQLPPRNNLVGSTELNATAYMARRVARVAQPTLPRARSQIYESQGPVIANGSSIPPPSMPNPLQRPANQRRGSMNMANLAAASAPASASSPTRSNTGTTTSQPPTEGELSPLRPSRNRPW